MSESLTRQEQLFGIREDDFGTLVGANERLYPFLRAARSLVDEAKVDPTADGLQIQAVDASNVGAVDVTVAIDGETPDDTLGVNIERLAGQLQNKPRDVTVTLDCGIPNGLLRVEEQFANGRTWDIRERVGFIDPDSIRERPNIPESDYDVTVDMATADLSTLINRLPKGKPVEFAVADGELSIGAATKSGESDVGQYHALATTAHDGDGEGAALYSRDYLTDICAGIKAIDTESVRLSWSDEFPMELYAEGEYVTAEWFLAPQVTKE